MTLEFLQRHRAGVFLVFFTAFASLCLALRIDPYVGGIKTTIWFLISPEIVHSGQFFNKLDSLTGRVFRLARVEGENVILREQVSRLSLRDIQRDALEIENNRLRELLGLREKMFSDAVAAEVVGRDIRDWFHVVHLNKGERDGVTLSAAVLVGSADAPTLVGRITELEPHASKVLLVTDLVSALSVGIEGKADMGLLEGKNQPWCVVRYLSYNSAVASGDQVLTMGLGGVFPPGVPVGRVMDVQLSIDGFFKEARVAPYTDFGSLTKVLVLKRKDVPMVVKPS